MEGLALMSLYRVIDLTTQGILLVDRAAQKVPGYKRAKGAVLDKLLGSKEPLEYESPTVPHN